MCVPVRFKKYELFNYSIYATTEKYICNGNG